MPAMRTSSSGGSQTTTSTTATAGNLNNGSTTKKKFGKNLNKLVKPAAPPIVDRSSGSCRNGLLLLSTKKNASSSAKAGGSNAGVNSKSKLAGLAPGGLLSKGTSLGTSSSLSKASGSVVSTATISTSTSLPYEPKAASTHDVLLSAVVGAAQADAHQAPDAWGVHAGATTASNNNNNNGPVNGGDAAANSHPSNLDERREPNSSAASVGSAGAEQLYEDNNASPSVVATSNWDEYGGRGDSVTANRKVIEVSGDDDRNDPQVYMSRKARERAEKRRSEEEARMLEQKERAAQRLKELDEKKLKKLRAEKQQKQQPSKKEDESDKGRNQTPPPPRGWDMTRSGTRDLWEPEQVDEDKKRGEDKSDSAGGVNGIAPQSPTEEAYNGPVIHLSSYDDRDRGEQRTAAAPRMLYDPKSGSMVAVKAPGEEKSSASNRIKNSIKAGGGKKGGRNGKDRENGVSSSIKDNSNHKKSDSIGSSGARDSSPDRATNKNSNSSRKQPKQQRGRGNGDEVVKGGSVAGSTRGSSAGASTRGSSGKQRKLPANADRRLPRTCGVLYRRDNKGSLYCADECEGDLGYGSHSVPGGRINNPEAHAEYLKQQGQQQDMYKGENNNSFDEQYDNMYEDGHYNEDGDGLDLALYTGFNPAEDDDDGEFQQPEPVEYVRADDKLELVTGVDDSPTLKPTAREWAPSHAALAAAAAAAANKPADVPANTSDEVEEEEDEDDDDEGPLGLGFDPTQDMDFVMHSPSAEEPDDHIESVALSALTLEPTMFSSTNDASGPRHLFAFGSSGTWGISHQSSAENGSEWKLPSVGESSTGGLFDAGGIFRGSSVDSRESTSFLNLPSSSSWGSPTLGLPATTGDIPSATTGD